MSNAATERDSGAAYRDQQWTTCSLDDLQFDPPGETHCRQAASQFLSSFNFHQAYMFARGNQ